MSANEEIIPVQTVKFNAGDTILSEGDAGDTAFLIIAGSVEVSIGGGAKAKSLGTLHAGDVFGEMSLIEPGPRSATVRAVTDAECFVTTYDAFIASAQADPEHAVQLVKTLVRRLRQMNERMAKINPGMGHRIQQWLHVILAGLDDHDALSAAEMETLQRELRMLLQIEHFQIATAEVDKAEQVLEYMLRPSIEECLNLWFGKFEQTDQEIWSQFGADVALASRGHYDHWALNVEHPRLLVALVIMLDQFRRNMYRETLQMYACDARCLALVKRGLRVGVSGRLRPIERVFLCLALTHSEALDDQHLCMEEWGRAMDELAPEDPLNAFHEIFHRHVAVIMRFGRFPHRNKVLQRANTPAEEELLENNSFRFDLPLIRQADGTLAFSTQPRAPELNATGDKRENCLNRCGGPESAPPMTSAGRLVGTLLSGVSFQLGRLPLASPPPQPWPPLAGSAPDASPDPAHRRGPVTWSRSIADKLAAGAVAAALGPALSAAT